MATSRNGPAPRDGRARAPSGRGRTVLALHGEMDVATAPDLREQLRRTLNPGIALLVLDLSDVQFCDAAGLAVLVGTQRRASGLGITLRLAAPGRQVTKVLGLTGLDRCFAVHATVADALRLPEDELPAAPAPTRHTRRHKPPSVAAR
ncbi:STAS domain-containing protein [Spirillospora sp. CA-294931]|uniref:STAS domain-containing protein n=1 Tax=Spirillospora sp. CA-294931 TaxID=3240042 RepID=UPI003D9284A6